MVSYVNVLYVICKCMVMHASGWLIPPGNYLTATHRALCQPSWGHGREETGNLSGSSTQLERDRTLHEQQT